MINSDNAQCSDDRTMSLAAFIFQLKIRMKSLKDKKINSVDIECGKNIFVKIHFAV